MSNRTRAFRRYKAEVKKRAVSRYGVAGYWYRKTPITDKGVLGRTATTPKNCSCWMCGNATKNHGLRRVDMRRMAVADIDLGLSE